eukprot:25009_1
MRFEKEFKTKMVQAWKNKYVRYDELKKHIKQIKSLYEQHHIPLNRGTQTLVSTDDIPSKIQENSLLKNNINHRTISPSLQNMKSLYSTINLNKKHRDNNQDIYQFNQVATVTEPNLSCKIPVFETRLYSIKAKETEFVVLLEHDIFTVSQFYAQQCRYFAKQHNALIIQVELIVQKTQTVIRQMSCPSRMPLNNPSLDHKNEDDSFYIDDEDTPDISMEDIKKQKSYLRLTFRQMYNAVRMLEEYRKLNERAFEKLTQKHDKNSGKFQNLQKHTMKFIRNECNFGNDTFILFLQERLETLYVNYLKPGDQYKREALERLNRPVSTKGLQLESFIIGLCGGWSIAILLVCGVLVIVNEGFWESHSTHRAWYMFRASLLLSIYLWLWGWDLWVFQSRGFNHGFIFGADPTTLMRVPDVLNIAAIFSVTTMLFTLGYVLTFFYPTVLNIDPEIFSVLALCCWILYMIIPFPWLHHTKRFLMQSIGRQIISPFSRVEFIDFFLADQWTSLFTLVGDLAFTFCYTFTGDFLLNGNQTSKQCDSKAVKVGLSLLKLIPYWIRVWQKIHRALEQKAKNKKMKPRPGKNDLKKLRWHMIGAGKYTISIIVVFINAFHAYYHTNISTIISVIFGAISTLYAYSYDIYKDWGLLHWNENKKHKLLRKEITFPALYYYIAMILNLVFRIAWAVSLYPASFGIYNYHLMHYVKLPLNLAEIVRRIIWNVFRMEHEHLNNCGDFRVVKDIPIAQNFERATNSNDGNGRQHSWNALKTIYQRSAVQSKSQVYDSLANNDDNEEEESKEIEQIQLYTHNGYAGNKQHINVSNYSKRKT